jgi:hypothetical protein
VKVIRTCHLGEAMCGLLLAVDGDAESVGRSTRTRGSQWLDPRATDAA